MYYTKPLIEYLKDLPDQRCIGKVKYDIAETLLLIIIGFLAGKTTVRRALRWCRNHIGWLKKHMALKNGIPSLATTCRILSSVDYTLLGLSFMEWAGEILDTRGIHIIIDGKALRGAVDNVKGTRTPMTLNAIDAATKLVIAQLPLAAKSGEITGIPELLKLLNIQESTVTVDAIGTQTNIMKQIVDQDGHFVQTVKKNQPNTYEEIYAILPLLAEEYKRVQSETGGKTESQYEGLIEKFDEFNSSEKNRDRYEHRTVRICTDASILSKFQTEWPFLKTVGQRIQVRIPIERDEDGNDVTPNKKEFLKNGSRRRPKPEEGDEKEDDYQCVGLISDRELSAEEMGKIKRDHWAIEDSVHHVLDEAFREDRSRAKKSKNTLAAIRKFAYNILRIAIISEDCPDSLIEAMDCFDADLSLMIKYVFSGIPCFY